MCCQTSNSRFKPRPFGDLEILTGWVWNRISDRTCPDFCDCFSCCRMYVLVTKPRSQFAILSLLAPNLNVSEIASYRLLCAHLRCITLDLVLLAWPQSIPGTS